MKRFFVLCTCLALVAPLTLGCQDKTTKKVESKTDTPSGSTSETHDTTTKTDK